MFSLSGSLPINVPAGSEVRAGTFRIPLGGLHTRAVLLPRRLPHAPTAPQRGIQLAVHPLAARAMFGVPASALTDEVLELEEVVGAATALRDRLDAGPAGVDAAAAVGQWLDARIRASSSPAPPPELARAWRLIVGSARPRPDRRRRPRRRLVPPASDHPHAGRDRRRRQGSGPAGPVPAIPVLMGRRAGSLGQIAGDCGYADQSHLTAEWREFAGCTPGQWLAAELPALSVGTRLTIPRDHISPRRLSDPRCHSLCP